MISFDRKAGNVNLTPLWNEINSIKSDTNSIWNFVSTITGVDVASSIMSSISDITNSLSSVMTDTSSIASDTAGLNMDVVSLYNFSSVMTSSISDIIGSLSTITGGGSGGPYYLAYSDAVNSSLHYVYNMTGDIPSLPSYDSFTFIGNLDTLKDYSVVNKSFKIHGLKMMSSLTFSTDSASNRFKYIDISAESMNSNNFTQYFSEVKLYANSFISNTLCSVSILNLSANNINGLSLRTATGTINVRDMSNCYFSSYYGAINANILSANTFTFVRTPLTAMNMYKNEIYHYSNKDICCGYEMGSNTFVIGDASEYMPNFHAPAFSYNSISICANNFTIDGNRIQNNTISLYTGHNATYSNNRIDIKGNESIYGNKIYNINSLNIYGAIQGNHVFSRISELRLFATYYTLAGGHGARGDLNAYSNISLMDFRGLTPPYDSYNYSIRFNPNSVIDISTLMINYNVKFSMDSSDYRIQPTNIYTIDFYNCDDYIGGSTFTIPSFYSGYDEVNVWISGKPLVDYSYSLSTSSA